jgi:hypothetical protein
MWTDLDQAVAGYGGPVKIGYGGWRNYGHGTPGPVEGVVCHHTAGPASGDTPSLNVVVYGRSDLPGPLCNLYLSRSGEVYLVAAGISYHAGETQQSWQDNNSAIGIEAEATGVDGWPEDQYHAYARLCSSLAIWYGLPVSHVMGHKEVCYPAGRKIDPNFDMNAFRQAVATGGGSAPGPSAFPDDEENQMLILFDDVKLEGDRWEYRLRGQRTCEAGGGSNIAKSAWACLSTAWGDAWISLAALNGRGGVTWLFGSQGKPAFIKNNSQIPFPLPDGSRVVTIEGTRQTPDTVVACDVYNLR